MYRGICIIDEFWKIEGKWRIESVVLYVIRLLCIVKGELKIKDWLGNTYG